MILGIRAHDLGVFNRPVDLAHTARGMGFDTVQLVPFKSFTHIERRPGIFNKFLADEIRTSFAEENLSISLLGAYFHWFAGNDDPGPEIFADHLRHASACGTNLVGTEVQGITSHRWRSNPENDTDEAFSSAVDMVCRLDQTVRPEEVCIGIEGAAAHVLSTPEKVRELKDRSDVRRIRFIFDLYNFLNGENWNQQEKIIDRALEFYGSDLAAIHCKDFLPDGFTLRQVAPGTGILNYEYLARRLLDMGMENIPMILEGVTGADITMSSAFLRQLMDRI
ncbi:MAG: TIM barrel protein [Spirochaetaceae bacterium]|nr:TIM barrel protein [Spirochaetaceae bacterium]MDT8297679.1 TIM barrel protein [Spirochaetaceae bacterium]